MTRGSSDVPDQELHGRIRQLLNAFVGELAFCLTHSCRRCIMLELGLDSHVGDLMRFVPCILQNSATCYSSIKGFRFCSEIIRSCLKQFKQTLKLCGVEKTALSEPAVSLDVIERFNSCGARRGKTNLPSQPRARSKPSTGFSAHPPYRPHFFRLSPALQL